MSTFMANKANIERKWYILDAAGKPLGKTAVQAADLLRGKNKPTFTPNADCGDHVIIINAGKAVLTGKKGHKAVFSAADTHCNAVTRLNHAVILYTSADAA